MLRWLGIGAAFCCTFCLTSCATRTWHDDSPYYVQAPDAQYPSRQARCQSLAGLWISPECFRALPDYATAAACTGYGSWNAQLGKCLVVHDGFVESYCQPDNAADKEYCLRHGKK